MAPTPRPKRKKTNNDDKGNPTQRKTRSSTQTTTSQSKYPTTPDGHYFIVRNRLWRCTNPTLNPSLRSDLQKQLMSARRALTMRNKEKSSKEEIEAAREMVQSVKEQLGERGTPWWDPDQGDVVDRKLVWNTQYKEWWESVTGNEKK